MDPSSDDDEVRDGEGSMLKTFPVPLPVLSMSTPLSRSIHALALRRDLISDIFVSNDLLISFVHVDNLVSARRLFDEMLSRDIVSWNAMLFGYSQGDHYENCLQLYRDMEACPDDVLPNAFIVLSVLQACFQLVNRTFGLEVHRFVVENNVKMNRTGWNSMICFYTKCGCLDFAYQVFDEMSDRDGVTIKGQKQRIQLSIAVYNNSDVCSLDDPFSAVDAHTGAHLFKECLMTLLSSRTVTHQLEFLAVRRFFLPPEDKAVLGFSEWVAAAFRKASIGNAISHVAEGRVNALQKVNLSSLQSQLDMCKILLDQARSVLSEVFAGSSQKLGPSYWEWIQEVATISVTRHILQRLYDLLEQEKSFTLQEIHSKERMISLVKELSKKGQRQRAIALAVEETENNYNNEEGLVEETQTSRTYAGNQCELVSTVKVQKDIRSLQEKDVAEASKLEERYNLKPGLPQEDGKIDYACASFRWRHMLIASANLEDVEIDVSEWFQTVTEYAITRTAFRRIFEDGKVVFNLQTQPMAFAAKAFRNIFNPGYRFLTDAGGLSFYYFD
ncbi:hypothetical protein ZIOFF_065153 [Zingiber officinale]|uniref:Pentatricopeptide repeat-containing protein n=1 Tax=Zingiber officinale TaxID=94328 RepID=A0A8J5KCZ8_ZINOF|nr:hypothetical protein ZIOFF_065153 [Zingiber officinale]